MRKLVLLLALPACAGPSPSTESCTDADSLDAGAVVATVNGTEWASTATWLWQGESLQINTNLADGWRIGFVGQQADTGETVKAAVDAGALPVTIPLGQTGAWALVYPADGDSYHTGKADGGTLVLTEVGEDLLACFSFGAATEGGETVDMSAGALHAVPF